MTILIINFEFPPLGGGGGVATQDLARELARSHEVHVLTTGWQHLPSREVQEGVHVHRVRVIGRRKLPTASLVSMITFVPAAFWAGIRLCRQHSFSVVNAQFVIPSGLPAVGLAKLFRIPLVISFIGGDIYDPTKGVSPHRHAVLRWLIRCIAHEATIATAISEDTKRRAQDLHGVQTPIVVTHLGLVPRTPAPRSRAELGLPPTVPLCVSVGRLIPRKRFDLLIRAWRDIPEAHVCIVGSGPEETALRRLVTQYELDDRVHLTGFVDEQQKLQILRVADVYVSAAEHEGYGIVFLEAMAAGLPIVATDNGGQTDFLINGKNALLVPARSEKELRQAVRRLLDDTQLRERIGEGNVEAVQAFYIDRTARKFAEVLAEAAQ